MSAPVRLAALSLALLPTAGAAQTPTMVDDRVASYDWVRPRRTSSAAR